LSFTITIPLDLDGVTSFHGSLATSAPAQPGQVKAKVLVLHGADDSFITPEQVTAFKQEMDKAGADYEFIAYPGATHGFTNPDVDELAQEFYMPIAYNAEVDQKSWEKMKGHWFRSIPWGPIPRRLRRC
jgi:dienelactone hydrolase